MKPRALTVIALIIAVLSTASLLAGLRHALRRERPAEASPRARARAALAGMLTELDPADYPPQLRPSAGLPADRRAYLASLPHLDPPISQRVREDRDARG